MAEVSTRATSGKVRLSYVHVFTPTAIEEGQEPKFNVSVIIDKKDKYTLSKYKAAIEAAEKKAIAEKYKGVKPKKWKTPLRDGDEEKEEDEAYQGAFFIGATSKRRPKVYNKDYSEMTDLDDLYSGCYARVVINFYPYDVAGNKGIAAGLESIMKLSDGEALGGGGGNPEVDFADNDKFIDEDDDLM